MYNQQQLMGDTNLALFQRVKPEPWDWSNSIPQQGCPNNGLSVPPPAVQLEGMCQNLGQSMPPHQQLPAPPEEKKPKKKRKPSTKASETQNSGTAAVKMEVKQENITSMMPVKKKRDRFNGMTEEEVLLRTLPDHLVTGLDIIIIGINPGLTAAYVGHHYAGPGNHFWKCLFLSGLVPEQLNAYDDARLKDYGIGFTNMVERTTRGSADLSKKEIKEGSEILTEKILKYKPKIAVFNGKGIYEVFLGHKHFDIGKQPDPFPGTEAAVYVMPSSSARCCQLPRAIDKVPFYLGLKALRDYLRGDDKELDITAVTFPGLELKVKPKVEPGTEGEAKETKPKTAGRKRKKKESPAEDAVPGPCSYMPPSSCFGGSPDQYGMFIKPEPGMYPGVKMEPGLAPRQDNMYGLTAMVKSEPSMYGLTAMVKSEPSPLTHFMGGSCSLGATIPPPCGFTGMTSGLLSTTATSSMAGFQGMPGLAPSHYPPGMFPPNFTNSAGGLPDVPPSGGPFTGMPSCRSQSSSLAHIISSSSALLIKQEDKHDLANYGAAIPTSLALYQNSVPGGALLGNSGFQYYPQSLPGGVAPGYVHPWYGNSHAN